MAILLLTDRIGALLLILPPVPSRGLEGTCALVLVVLLVVLVLVVLGLAVLLEDKSDPSEATDRPRGLDMGLCIPLPPLPPVLLLPPVLPLPPVSLCVPGLDSDPPAVVGPVGVVGSLGSEPKLYSADPTLPTLPPVELKVD